MGTAFNTTAVPQNVLGIIPRAINQIYDSIIDLKRLANEGQHPEPKFTIDVQFIEVRYFNFV
jgi:hypothetical protein